MVFSHSLFIVVLHLDAKSHQHTSHCQYIAWLVIHHQSGIVIHMGKKDCSEPRSETSDVNQY